MKANSDLKCLTTALIGLSILQATCDYDLRGQEHAVPKEATVWRQLSSDGIQAVVHDKTVWLQLDPSVANSGKAIIPRLCAPIRSFRWKDQSKAELKFLPEPKQWVFSWKTAPAQPSVIEVKFDTTPVLPSDCPAAVPAGDGSVMLHAYQASTFGEKLRFEPQWYKNTVGYWAVASDYASWDLSIDQPGTFSVAVLQGCGQGQGGSDAVISLRQGDALKADLPFQTIDTGHFQNFRWNHLGTIDISAAGSYQLRIDAKRIAKNALFDVRAIHLVRQAKPASDR